VNPFKGQSWYAGRIDMGVDYMARRREPVRAIGRAKVLGADRHSGWPGGHFIWYKLLRGDHRGDIIYVAETLKHLVPRGTTVPAGHRIATALPGGTGTEWGWATRSGQARAAASFCPWVPMSATGCDDGDPTSPAAGAARHRVARTGASPPGRG
jgi:hypothetical protein